jgi:hypothetical protein
MSEGSRLQDAQEGRPLKLRNTLLPSMPIFGTLIDFRSLEI